MKIISYIFITLFFLIIILGLLPQENFINFCSYIINVFVINFLTIISSVTAVYSILLTIYGKDFLFKFKYLTNCEKLHKSSKNNYYGICFLNKLEIIKMFSISEIDAVFGVELSILEMLLITPQQNNEQHIYTICNNSLYVEIFNSLCFKGLMQKLDGTILWLEDNTIDINKHYYQMNNYLPSLFNIKYNYEFFSPNKKYILIYDN